MFEGTEEIYPSGGLHKPGGGSYHNTRSRHLSSARQRRPLIQEATYRRQGNVTGSSFHSECHVDVYSAFVRELTFSPWGL